MRTTPFLSLWSALMLALLPFPALPAGAATPGAWQVGDDSARVPAAGIALPTSAGALNLIKSGELSDGGAGIDNIAQYMSQDGAIQATAFIYLTSYADAAIAAYMTDKAVRAHFGPATRRTAWAAGPVGGVANGAIRAFYDGAADGQLVTASALIHAGRWLVKLRVTGPTPRRAEVAKAMDALLAGSRFDPGTQVHPARAQTVAPCGSAHRQAVADAGFPRDGQDALCVARSIRTVDGSYELLRPVDAAGPVIVPLDDAGRTLRFVRQGRSGSYQMTIHSVGRLDIYDSYAAIPDERQLAAMIDGTDRHAATPRSSTLYAANGMATPIAGQESH